MAREVEVKMIVVVAVGMGAKHGREAVAGPRVAMTRSANAATGAAVNGVPMSATRGGCS